MLIKRICQSVVLGSTISLLAACGGGGGGSSSGPESAPGEPVSGQSSSDSPAISYHSAVKPLLDRYCVSCHSDTGVEAGLSPFPMENYSQVQGKRSALIYVLEAGTMPPLGYKGLNDAETELMLGWLEEGAPKGDVSQTPAVQVSGKYTYHRDVRPIIEDKCVGCHVPGGIAPFPLQNYESVRAVSAAAAFSVDNGSMPPWPPTPGYTSYLHERGLTQEQNYVLSDWLAGDMDEGNPADYVAPETTIEVDPPKYNINLKLPQAYTPNLRPDDHRCFAIEWPEDEFTYVVGVDVTPDQVDEVHHVIVSIAEPEDAGLYYAAGGQDGSPGWHCLGAGGVSGAPLPRQIGGWVPGAGRERTSKGLGIGVKPGSVMVVQMHYNTLVAEPAPDQSQIRVSTAKEVERPSRALLFTQPRWLGNGGMPIPAGDPEVTHAWTFPAFAIPLVFGGEVGLSAGDPWVMHQGFLHMHSLGMRARTTLFRADGTEQVLLDIVDWDFNWQGTYNFENEILIQPADRIRIECTWDNSQENQQFVNGVQQTAQYVQWGDGTGDEMCLMSVLMTHPAPDVDYSYSPSVYIGSPTYRQRFAPGSLVPLRLTLNNFSLHDPGEHGHDDTSQHDDHEQVYEGHYHVYLDSNDDDAEHLTAWDESYYYPLPEDIEPGIHTIRVSLRGGDHHPLGIEQTVEIEVTNEQVGASSSLVDVDAWTEQVADNDLLANHRPASVDCPANSWYNEDGALEVETGYCNYLSAVQPSKVAIEAGDTVHLVLWHGNLAFEDPTTAHVAISIAGETIWQAKVDIPTKAEIYDLRIPIDFNVPKGSEVEYHLHNHGYNSWTLLKLEVER